MKDCRKDIKEIKDIQRYIDTLYSEVNKNREWDYLYGYLSRTAGLISKLVTHAIRYQRLDDLDRRQFILSLSWLMSLSNYFQIDVTEAYLKKYPGICPYCISSPCVCYKTNKMPYRNMPQYRIEEERMFLYEEIKDQRTLIDSQWVLDNIRAIYPA